MTDEFDFKENNEKYGMTFKLREIKKNVAIDGWHSPGGGLARGMRAFFKETSLYDLVYGSYWWEDVTKLNLEGLRVFKNRLRTARYEMYL